MEERIGRQLVVGVGELCFTGLNKMGNWEGEVEKEQVAEQRSGEKKKL